MALTRQLPSPFGWLLPRTRAPWVGIIVLAAIPILMNAFGAAEGAKFLQLILAGVLGWVTAYFLIHVSVLVLRRREPGATRPYRAPLVPLPQILGAGLLALGAYKIAPPGIEADSIYYRWLIFLAIRPRSPCSTTCTPTGAWARSSSPCRSPRSIARPS